MRLRSSRRPSWWCVPPAPLHGKPCTERAARANRDNNLRSVASTPPTAGCGVWGWRPPSALEQASSNVYEWPMAANPMRLRPGQRPPPLLRHPSRRRLRTNPRFLTQLRLAPETHMPHCKKRHREWFLQVEQSSGPDRWVLPPGLAWICASTGSRLRCMSMVETDREWCPFWVEKFSFGNFLVIN